MSDAQEVINHINEKLKQNLMNKGGKKLDQVYKMYCSRPQWHSIKGELYGSFWRRLQNFQ